MPSKKRWSFSYNPNKGGEKIPESVKHDVECRILKFAGEHFKGKYSRLEFRFKGQFCYIDAYEEPKIADYLPLEGWPGTRDEYIEHLRNIPIHLCRLRYLGDDKWGFAFYTYSNDRYELSVFPDGSFYGKPEDAFMVAANAYFSG